jgi:hypothetical protein
MKGLHRSFKRVENALVKEMDRKRAALRSSAVAVAKRDNKRARILRQERRIALFALAKDGVLRIPGPRSAKTLREAR